MQVQISETSSEDQSETFANSVELSSDYIYITVWAAVILLISSRLSSSTHQGTNSFYCPQK